MLIHRRKFLKGAAAAGSVLALPRLTWAQGTKKTEGARTLVYLHLNGGNDGLNTVIPYQDAEYRVLRPGIGINTGQVRKISENLGLHPALGGFERMWRRDRLAIVNGVGYPKPNYSHFRATEIWFTAEPEKNPNYGWLGRAMDKNPKKKPLRAVSLSREKPLSLNAAEPGVATLNNFQDFQLPKDVRIAVDLYRRYRGLEGARGKVGRAGSDAIAVADKIAALRPAGGGFYGRLGQDLRKVISLLRSDIDLEVIQLNFGGWDTHANQGPRHNQLLAQVGNNLASFQDQLERLGLADRVLTVVVSEFGRRATENLSGGTDHGSAGPVFLLGKGVKPGFHGAYPSLEDLDRNNFKYTTDFRSVYAGVLENFLGLDAKPVLGEHKAMELWA